MPYRGSYLWRLRQVIGHELVLMPGAMIALQRADQRILLTKRTDDGSWCLPAGAAEPGGSFARTAADELVDPPENTFRWIGRVSAAGDEHHDSGPEDRDRSE